MELYNIVWGDYILNKKPLTLEKAEQELQGLKFYEPEIKKAKNQLKESNMDGFGNDLLSVIKEIESMIMNKKLGNIENHKKAQAELKILKDAYNIMWKYEPIMRLTELKQVIRKEISAGLNEANDPKQIHLQTRKTKSIKDPAYPFYVIKDYMDVGYWDKVKEADFKKAFDSVIGFLLTPGSNTERLSKENNWMIGYEELWQYQQDKED